MTDSTDLNGIYFIYDGECPLCTRTALALRIKKDYGSLHLLDARLNLDHPIVKQVTALKLDLDDGMVLYDGIAFYHGKDALRFMAKYSSARNLFNSAIKSLYWSDIMARLTYPLMRATRNWLLTRKGVTQIDNLGLKNEPVFKSVFGDSWKELPPVMHKHYANHPYSDHSTLVKGKLDVMCTGPIKWLSPLFWMMKGIPPVTEHNVDVTVEFKSDLSSTAFYFDRTFYFKNRKPYRFRSKMIQIQGNELVEVMASGFSWRMTVVWDGNCVKLKHKGYGFYLLGILIPLPITPIIGAGNAYEKAINENIFDMSVEITHPFWGMIYGYKGRFETMENH